MRTDPHVADHSKIDSLCKELDPSYQSGRDAFRCWMRLLGYVADHKPDGVLGNSATWIELHAGWRGEPGAFVKAMLKLRLLDEDLYGYGVHNWKRRQPFIVGREQRSQLASYAAACRWNKERSTDQPTDQTDQLNRQTEKPQSPSRRATSPTETKPQTQACVPHAHAPTNQPTNGNTGFTTVPVWKKMAGNDGTTAQMRDVMPALLNDLKPRRPNPAAVSRDWELWDVFRVVLKRWRWTDDEASAAISHCRGRPDIGTDPDGYRLHKIVTWGIAAARYAKRTKIGYFRKCRGDPTPEQDDEAKQAIDMAIAEVGRRRTAQPQEARA